MAIGRVQFPEDHWFKGLISILAVAQRSPLFFATWASLLWPLASSRYTSPDASAGKTEITIQPNHGSGNPSPLPYSTGQKQLPGPVTQEDYPITGDEDYWGLS